MLGVDDIDVQHLMPLETPVLKVSRPVAACSRCRTAKIKCDGKLPACTSCEKNGRADECTSTNDQFARGKERSYVSTLETRVDKLRAKLEDVRRRKPSVVSIPDEDTATVVPSRRASYEPRAAPGPATPTISRAQRREEASAVDELVSGFGFLSVNATARDFYGFSSAMSYARLILSACTKDPLPQAMVKGLPPHNVTAQLAQHYFDNFFQLMPVFDKASFYASLDNVYRGVPDQAQPIDHWMLHMVLAISSATLSERSGDQAHFDGVGHVNAALRHAEAVLHPGSITSVQALVLLVEYAMLDPHHFDSWSLIGAASRAMVDLGLHQDPPKGTAMSRHKLELRRRVFWCVYCFDRSTSLVQTRAFSFSDQSAKVKEPFSKPMASQPQSPVPQRPSTWRDTHHHTLTLIGLRRIQSEWYSDLFQSGRSKWDDPYPYIWNACDQMKTWFENIASSTPPPMMAFFELDLLYSYVYVLSPSPRVPTVIPYAQTLIFEHCIKFADLMLHRISVAKHTAPTTFYDAMRVYMTGRQFLDVLQENTENLLNGIVPQKPEVKTLAKPPQSLPVINLPPGDSVQHFNTARSIRCIEQISECLSRFGVRWGYMSWNERYRRETSELMADLTGRLRALEVQAGTRRPSMWQSNSTGSIGSNNSGAQYVSPHNSTQGQPIYQSPPAMQGFAPPPASSSYTEAGPSYSMPQYQQQAQDSYPPQNFTGQHNYPVQPANNQFPGSQPFAFDNGPPPTSFNTNPHSQFGTWGGYGGPSVPDTLDEENAVPPNSAAELSTNPIAANPTVSDYINTLSQSVGQQNDSQPQAEQPPVDPQNTESASVNHRVKVPPPPQYDEHGQRRPSMQDAADIMTWETFHAPGTTDLAMLPPQPSRNSSLGQPLQLTDSNQTVRYTGKGKGRVRDLEPGQQQQQQVFDVWQRPSITGFENLPMWYPQHPDDPMNQFSFLPNQLGEIDQQTILDAIQMEQQQQQEQTTAPEPQPPESQPPESQDFSYAHPHGHPQPGEQPPTLAPGPAFQQRDALLSSAQGLPTLESASQLPPLAPAPQQQNHLPSQAAHQPASGFTPQPPPPQQSGPASAGIQLPPNAIQRRSKNARARAKKARQKKARDREQALDQLRQSNSNSNSALAVAPQAGPGSSNSGFRFQQDRGFVCGVCGWGGARPVLHRYGGVRDGPFCQGDGFLLVRAPVEGMGWGVGGLELDGGELGGGEQGGGEQWFRF